MSLGPTLGTLLRGLDRRIGIRAWLTGEPKPPTGGFDLKGEKLLDWGWVCVNLPPGVKRALEIGSGESPIIPAMLALGYSVLAVDLCTDLSKQIGGFTFVKADFNAINLDPRFDVVVACSTVEHIGLSGRYRSNEDEDGDLNAMRKIADLLNPEGLLLLTIPMGIDAVYKPWHRVYGRQRIGKLVEGFQVVKSRFLIKEPWGPWHEATLDKALDFPADVHRYALGEMMLCKKT